MRRFLRGFVPRPWRNAARSPGATIRWSWHDLQYRLGRTPFVEVTADWRVRCHPASRVVFEAHRDEPEFRSELAGFARAATPGMVLVDVGAHLGFFTLAALHHGGPTSRVVAVEPSASALSVLEANVRLAEADDRVTVIHAALGSHSGWLHALTTGAGGLHQLVRPDAPRADTVAVPVRRLDDLVADLGLTPTHVKIDVEGFEGDVIEGGRACLAAHHPVIFLELHGALLRQAGDDAARVLAVLAEDGYAVLEANGRPISARDAAAAPLIRLVCRSR
jgi:FkbM family methyltransferase